MTLASFNVHGAMMNHLSPSPIKSLSISTSTKLLRRKGNIGQKRNHKAVTIANGVTKSVRDRRKQSIEKGCPARGPQAAPREAHA